MTNEIQKVDEKQKSIFDPDSYNHMMMIAETFSKVDFIPDIYKGNVGNCFVATQYAARLNTDPIQFMQNSYLVHGKPGIQSVFAIGLANESNLIDGLIQYKMSGDSRNRSCVAYAKLRNGDTVEAECNMEMVRAEKWDTKPGSKWKTIPNQMLKYRAAMFLIRTSFPQVILGLQSKEEIIDTEKQTKNITTEVQTLDLSSVKKPVVKIIDEVFQEEVEELEPELTSNQIITSLFKQLSKEQQIAVKKTQKSVAEMNEDEKLEMIAYLSEIVGD